MDHYRAYIYTICDDMYDIHCTYNLKLYRQNMDPCHVDMDDNYAVK